MRLKARVARTSSVPTLHPAPPGEALWSSSRPWCIPLMDQPPNSSTHINWSIGKAMRPLYLQPTSMTPGRLQKTLPVWDTRASSPPRVSESCTPELYSDISGTQISVSSGLLWPAAM